MALIKGKSKKAFFERKSWCHRYKIISPECKILYRKKGGFKTEEEAVASYKIYEEQFKEQCKKYIVKKEMYVKAFFEYWFEEIYSLRIQPNTKSIGAYIVYDLIIPSIIYDIRLDLATADYFDNILNIAAKRTKYSGVAASSYIRMAIKDAFSMGLINYDYVEEIKKFHREKPRITVLNLSEQSKLLEQAENTQWFLEILLGLYCGLRKAEILGLKFSDIDFENKVLFVQRQLFIEKTIEKGTSKVLNTQLKESTPKTKNSIRKFKLPDLVLEEILKRKVEVEKIKKLSPNYNDNDYISCQKNGKPHGLTSLNDAIARICKIVSLPHITVHSLRHMCATMLLEEGTELAKISAFLGHSSVHTTFEYYCEIVDGRNKILSYINDIYKNGSIEGALC